MEDTNTESNGSGGVLILAATPDTHKMGSVAVHRDEFANVN